MKELGAAQSSAVGSRVHILVDAHVFDPRGRGMSHFAYKFIEGLASTECEMRFTVLTRFPRLLPAAAHLRSVKIPQVPAPLWEQLLLPFFVRRFRPDILHSLANTAPVLRLRGVRQVLTLHDLIFMHPDPEISAGNNLVQKIGKMYRAMICNWAVPICEQIITVSDDSRKQIESRFPTQRGRVQIVYEGPSLVASAGAAVAAEGPFVLLPGGNHSRKNAQRAIEAFLRFRKRTGSDWRLLVSGIRPNQLDLRKLGGASEGTDAERSVRLLGYVPEDQLASLFRSARLVFFPSLYEGFGIPVLDSMTVGTPVLTSDAGALPEVGGDAVMYADPRSVDDMAEALSKLYRDPSLRRALAERAIERAKRFPWEMVTSRTLDVYRSVAADGGAVV